jgi:hypothetical protein
MNDAMNKTVAMVVDGVKACGVGRKTLAREELHTITIFVDQAFEGRETAIGHVTVYESGRWQQFRRGDSGARLMNESPELAALCSRRTA